MKRKYLLTASLAAAGLIGIALAGTAMAHGSGNGQGGMMGGVQGYGSQPMMGAMMGQMGQGMMGQAMMGQGINNGAKDMTLTPERVKTMLEGRLAWMGNPNIKVGEVKAKDDTTITAEIVTKDGSLVKHLEFDRKTGASHPTP